MAIETPSLTPSEKEQLRRFVRATFEMSKCRFIERASTQDQTVKMEKVGDDDYKLTYPDYDFEDFRSFLTLFRQVAISQEEPIYLPAVRSIVARHAPTHYSEFLKRFKKQIMPILEGRIVQVRFCQTTEKGSVALSGHELLYALVNGMIFHGDDQHEVKIAAIRKSEPWQYIWIVLTQVIVPVLNACAWLVNLIRVEKLLDESEFAAFEK